MKLDEILSRFRQPPAGYAPVPFWSVNSTMDAPTIRRSLEDQRGQGIEEVIIHTRSGLEVEYLSEEFWVGMDVIVSELIRLGMKGWLYDDYNWPSGIAGGILLRERPDFRQRHLNWTIWTHRKSTELKGPLIAAFDISRDFKYIPDQENLRTFIPPRGAGDCLVFYEERMTDRTFATSCAPWAKAEPGVLDYLNPEAVDYFMELTHRQYEKRYSRHFGKSIVGMFTDEPQNYRGVPWCEDMLSVFKDRIGYDLYSKLYCLAVDAPEAARVRADFYRLCGELFRERYYEPVAKWCENNKLIFTGHLGQEEFLSVMAANHGSVYPPLSAMHMPGIDVLGIGHGFGKGVVNSEVPNFAPKAVSSIAHLLERKRSLVELWGGGGWAASPKRLKKPLDWLFACGVNFINPHLVWVSAKGLRKRDFPQSFSPQQPWWKIFKPFSEYISRISALISEGTHRARVLVLFPSTGIHAASMGRGAVSGELNATVNRISNLTTELLKNGHDFDYMFEEAVEKYRVESGAIHAGIERFDSLIIPAAKRISGKAFDIARLAKADGITVISYGKPPSEDEQGNTLEYKFDDVFSFIAEGAESIREVVEWLDVKVPPFAKVTAPARRIVLAHHRRIEDAEIVFIADITDDPDAAKGPVTLRVSGGANRLARLLNPRDGSEFTKVDTANDHADLVVTLHIEPGESIVAVFPTGASTAETGSRKAAIFSRRKIIPLEIWTRKALDKNIFPLEPCEIVADRKPAQPLNRLRLDRRFGARSKLIAMALRAATTALEISPLKRKYRFERFFDFEAAFKGVKLAEKVLGIPISKLGLYEGADLIDAWAEYFTVPPGMGKTFPPNGAEYRLEKRIQADFVPDDVALVYEELGEKVAVTVNGRKMPGGEPGFVWDASNRVIPLRDVFKRGENIISFESRIPDFPTMYPTIHAPEIVALIGSFHIYNKGVSGPEETTGGLRSWTHEGFPYYSGAMQYRCSVSVDAANMIEAILDLGDVREVAEVRVNGTGAGKLLWPPYRTDIAPFIKNGENDIEVVVHNTGANLFHKPIKSGLLGPVTLTIDAE